MAGIPVREFLADQRRDLPLVVTAENTSGKTYIVTGGNRGLGLETCRHLARAGAAKVIIACRSVQAGEEAKADVESSTKTRNVVEVWKLDLASFDSVKAFAERASKELDRIDGLIENAGVALNYWSSMAEGHEITITTNVLSTVLLAVLMLPKLGECARRYENTPHIVIVGSEVAFGIKPEFDKVKDDPFNKMKDQKLADMSQRYQLSKLVQFYAIRHLASMIASSRSGVVLNVNNPGLCKSKLSQHATLMYRIQVKIGLALIGRTMEMGSRTILFAVNAGEASHGKYVSACEIRERQIPEWVENEHKAKKLIWDGIVRELEAAAPGCLAKIQ